VDARQFISRASAPGGVRQLVREALTGQVGRLAGGSCVPVLPLARRPFETYAKLHFHQGFEIVIQVLGASRWELLEDAVEVPADGLLLIPRGVPHVERLIAGESCDCNVNIYVSQELVTYHGFAWEAPDSRQMIGQAELRGAEPRALFDMLAETVAAYERGGRESTAVRGLLLAVTSLLGEAFAAPEAPAESGSRLVSLCRQEALRYLCSTKLNVGWLAEHLGCNADYLSHLFKRHTGQRLNAFITEERLKLGRYLLQSSTLSVGEVASSCGYGDPDYFSRIFRRSAGKSPGEFRAAARHGAG